MCWEGVLGGDVRGAGMGWDGRWRGRIGMGMGCGEDGRAFMKSER